MKLLPIISFALLCISCTNHKTNAVDQTPNPKELPKTSTETENSSGRIETKGYPNEVMKEDDILFNGKLKRYFTLKEFKTVFGTADSLKLMIAEEPCSYIFENEDGSKDSEDRYIYKEGSRFENSKEKVAVDEFRFTKNNFIVFKGHTLNSFSTLTDLQRLFPNAVQNITTMDMSGEGKIQVIQLREDDTNVSDGHINIGIKKGKLYFIHWWFPC